MNKCEFCGSFSKNSALECASCGAKLPGRPDQPYEAYQSNRRAAAPSSSPQMKGITTQKTPQKKTSPFAVIFLASMALIMLFVFIMPRDKTAETTTTSVSQGEEELDPAWIQIIDETKFDEMNAAFLADSANKEAAHYLVSYYLSQTENYTARQIWEEFAAHEIKDDPQIYIDIASEFLHYNLPGAGAVIAKKGVDLTKMERAEIFYNNLLVKDWVTDPALRLALEIMFGKGISNITFEDVGTVTMLSYHGGGSSLLLSTKTPERYYGNIKDHAAFRTEQTTGIVLNSPIVDYKDLHIFDSISMLELSNIDVTTEMIGAFPKLDYLYFGDPQQEVEKVPQHPNLKGISLYGSRFKALGDIGEYAQLEHLSIASSDVVDFSNITKIEHLQSLILVDNDNMSSLDFVSQMSELRRLKIENSDLMALALPVENNMLESLDINETKIRNLDFLSELTELTDLSVVKNGELISLPSLDKLTKLTSLRISPTGADYWKDIRFLSGLTQLKTLAVFGNMDLYPLQSLVNLEELLINHAIIEDFSSLGSLTNLKKLSINGNGNGRIINLSFLSSLGELEYLDLTNGALAVRVGGLFGLSKLTYLSLEDCDIIGDFSGIGNLTLLEELHLTKATFVEQATYQSDGFISSYDTSGVKPINNYNEALGRLVNLKVLLLGKTKLENLDFATSLSHLEILRFADNYVTDLTPLALLTKLILIDTTDNPVTQWAGMKEKIRVIEGTK